MWGSCQLPLAFGPPCNALPCLALPPPLPYNAALELGVAACSPYSPPLPLQVAWQADRHRHARPMRCTHARGVLARLSFPSRLTVLSERIPRLESGWLKRTSSALEVGCGVYPALTTSRGKRMNMVGLVRVYSK
ncbi:hypothetical protein IWX49DRAFT_40693 [Phyllosticta citricarpa]